MTRANLLALETSTPTRRRELLRQSSELCQRAIVLSQAANDTLMTCQAMWLLSRVHCNSTQDGRVDAYSKALSITQEAMDMLGVTYGEAFMRGEPTGGRTLSECLMRQYLKLVQLLARYRGG